MSNRTPATIEVVEAPATITPELQAELQETLRPVVEKAIDDHLEDMVLAWFDRLGDEAKEALGVLGVMGWSGVDALTDLGATIEHRYAGELLKKSGTANILAAIVLAASDGAWERAR